MKESFLKQKKNIAIFIKFTEKTILLCNICERPKKIFGHISGKREKNLSTHARLHHALFHSSTILNIVLQKKGLAKNNFIIERFFAIMYQKGKKNPSNGRSRIFLVVHATITGLRVRTGR